MGSASWSKNNVTNPITGENLVIRGYDNATNYQIAAMNNQAAVKLQEGQNAWNRKQWEDTNAWNEEMWQKEKDWNYNMWQENNEYNSPAEQRQRLVEAGYNPLMVSGSFGGSSGGSAPSTSAPSASPAQGVDPPQLSTPTMVDEVGAMVQSIVGAIGGLNESIKTGMQAYEMPSRIFNDAQRTEAEASYKKSMVSEINKKMPWIDQLNYGELVNRYADTSAKEAAARASDAGAAYVKEQTAWLPKITDAQINKITSEISVNDKQIEKMDSEIQLVAHEIMEADSRSAVNWNTARGLKLQNELTEKYGEQQTQMAIRQYEDMHISNIVDRMMTVLQIRSAERPKVEQAVRLMEFRDEQSVAEMLRLLKDVKDHNTIPTGQGMKNYEALGVLIGLGAEKTFNWIRSGVSDTYMPSYSKSYSH